MSDTELKAKFAAELLRNPKEPFLAGLSVFPNDNGRALRAAYEWPNDPEVKAEQARLTAKDGGAGFLPSKAELARAIWDKSTAAYDAEDFTKLAKLYADVMGFIQKPEPAVNVNVNNNRVMVVKDHGTNEEWAEKLAAQQRELTNVAESRH